MERPRTCSFPTPSDKRGFVLALALVFLAIALGFSLAVVSLANTHLKSSGAFLKTLQQMYLDASSGSTKTKITVMDAPDGWDHIHFCTELAETVSKNVVTYSWRAGVRRECMPLHPGLLTPTRPAAVVILLDDSVFMLESSGADYEHDALFHKAPAGCITRVSECSEVEDSVTTALGTFFRGSYGNVHERAPAGHGRTGAMPVVALAFTHALSLLEGLGGCTVALAGISGGILHPFTADIPVLIRTIRTIPLSHPQAQLAESLYRSLGMFTDPCTPSRHVILVTAGVPAHDGNLPGWLADYDHDSNPDDRFLEGEGSHCLDDVASYARACGVSVHVVGPDTAFLRQVASKGGGKFMPLPQDVSARGMSVSVPPVALGGKVLILANNDGDLRPSWLSSDHAERFRESVCNPPEEVTCADIPLAGHATAFSHDGRDLFCTTACDRIARIDLARQSLESVVLGIGGEVVIRGGRVIAGPSSEGTVTALTPDLRVQWRARGDCVDASDSTVYCSQGSTIHGLARETGETVCVAHAGSPVTSLRYDPVAGAVLAGTSDGLVFVLDEGLKMAGVLSTGTGDAITDTRPFSLRGLQCVLAATKGRLCLFRDATLSWSLEAGGLVMAATVMDAGAFAVVWRMDDACAGADAGVSTLLVVDAAAGTVEKSVTLCTGLALGPCVDLSSGLARFVSFLGVTAQEDITGLHGVLPAGLGRKLAFGIE